MSDEAERLFDELSGYLKPEDIAQLQNVYRFSQDAHSGQFRQSGEPYISHPLAVASILATLHLDAQVLAAALLHDVMEDTHVSKGELADMFGKSVAELVDGVSKLDKIESQTQADAQAENFRKMLLAMARDVRVILIKLADRLHNMRTLQSMPPSSRERIAKETLDIYAPIANRLGLHVIYQELQELAFRHLYPTRYQVLAKATKAARGNRREVVGKILQAIKDSLKHAGVQAQVSGREKHLYSIYKKMAGKNLTFSEVLDIYGFRVIVDSIPACYAALGALHGLYKPIPGKFKDFIALPKANGYQSLHTKLIGPFGLPIEIQIRTIDMHRLAEAGVASHWLYKSSDADLTELNRKTHQWLQSLLESLSETADSAEFLEHLKVDLFPGEVYVFTPQGKILSLPRGATAVDFAYTVHSDIGDACVAVKINGENAPLRSVLQNGDRVEIITAPNARPNPAWLGYVVTSKARTHIRRSLKTLRQGEAAQLGERMLNQALASLNISPATLTAADWERVQKSAAVKSRQDLLAEIALGKHIAMVVAKKLVSPGEKISSKENGKTSITILGTEGMAVQFAKCCCPIPGDPIVGFIKKDQGLIVHTHDCPVIAKSRPHPDKWLDVSWDPALAKPFEVSIKLMAANQPGVLAQVATEIAAAGSNIDSVLVEGEGTGSGAYTTMQFMLQVNNRLHLAQVMRGLRRIPEVVRISRMKGR